MEIKKYEKIVLPKTLTMQLKTTFENADEITKVDDINVKIKQNGKYGIYDTVNNKFILSELCNDIISYNDYFISNNEIYDCHGKLCLDNIEIFDYTPLEDGFVIIRDSGKFGIIDLNKNKILPIVYDDIKYYNQNRIIAYQENKGTYLFGIKDKKGRKYATKYDFVKNIRYKICKKNLIIHIKYVY